MSINSQEKGKRAERAVAKIINDTLGTNCSRTPNSGGLSIKGDIIDIGIDSIAHLYHFEIKDRKALCIKKWWEQAIGDCSAHKTPVLIFKMDGRFYAMQRIEDFLGNLKSIDEADKDYEQIEKELSK